GVCASRLVKFQLKAYVGHTVHAQVDELKEAFIPAADLKGVACQVRAIAEKQHAKPRYDYASNEQLEIDRLVYAAYGLSEADIREVEDWYARRYPSLAQAQRRALAAKRGKTEEQLSTRPTLNLYCDESRHLPHDREPFALLGGVQSLNGASGHTYNAELASVWKEQKLAPDFEA